MKLSDNQQAREQVDALLKNWGRWCRDDFYRHLGFGEQPVFRDYRAPRQEATKLRVAVDVDEAWLSQDAMTALFKAGFQDEFWLLAAWYAYAMKYQKMADIFGCAVSTLYERRNRAMQVFFDQRQKITPKKGKKAE